MHRRDVVALVAGGLAARTAAAAFQDRPMPLRKFLVTIRVFDPGKGLAGGTDYELPVDSPDEEHAAASTMSNAISFTTKMSGGEPLPVAFCCMAVKPRA